MTSNDVRDILDVKATDPRPTKKQKLVVRRPDNISKEVFSLIGERLPPVVLQPETEKYQKKFKVTRKAQPWDWQAFKNPCRNDELVLHHWVKKLNVQPNAPEAPATPAEAKGDEVKNGTPRSTGSHWTQYNHKVVVPEYDDATYEAQLKSEDWTRDETDYLFQLVRDFDLRWTLVADRYDFTPKETEGDDETTAVAPAAKTRSMEDMKARYYQVASKAIVIKQPLASMSEQEFEAYERMTKYDPVRETTRKKLAEALLARSPEEIKEEETLLSELKRIVTNEEKFLQERKELYQRLDHPLAQGSISAYESSSGLNALVQTLLHADKARKRRSITGAGETTSSPAQMTPSQNTPGLSRDHRGSISGQSATKKGSIGGGNTSRQLSSRDEAKYGVSTHERLTSGVSFRSNRVEKLITAKSTSQSQKLQGVLNQLSLPLRPVMPSTKVCDEYEQLVQSVHKLLDVRKHNEKTMNEIKVLTAQKEAREKRENGEEDSSMVDAQNDETQGTAESNADVKDDSEEPDADADGDADEDAEGENEEEGESQAGALPRPASDDEEGNDQPYQENEASEAGDSQSNAAAEADVAASEDDGEDEGEDEDLKEFAKEDPDEDDAEVEEEDEKGKGEESVEDNIRASIAPSTRSARSARSAGLHKRSASVLSTPSEKSTKRQKK